MTAPTKQDLIARFGEPDDIADDPTNPTGAQRVEWGRHAVESYGIVVNGSVDADDDEGMAGDLIADVMHYLTSRGVDADAVIEKARRNFIAEVGRGYDE